MYEEFIDIKGYEGSYKVSNRGNIVSLKNNNYRLLKIIIGNHGYPVINLHKSGVKKTRLIHQLVAEAFIGHVVDGLVLVVNHIDFNKQNNIVSNLEIVTQRENSNKKHLKSSSKYTGVYYSKHHEKWGVSIRTGKNRRYLGMFDTEIQASKEYDKELEKINKTT